MYSIPIAYNKIPVNPNLYENTLESPLETDKLKGLNMRCLLKGFL
uniref:Uncharacterized protein n=1 Tax=Arundo donax TaxID=35708 RepID=A0A0A9AIA8_ARUDO